MKILRTMKLKCAKVQTDKVTADQIVSNSTIMPLNCFRVTHISWVKPRGPRRLRGPELTAHAGCFSVKIFLVNNSHLDSYVLSSLQRGGRGLVSSRGGGSGGRGRDQSGDLDRRSGGHRVGRLPSLAAYLICF